MSFIARVLELKYDNIHKVGKSTRINLIYRPLYYFVTAATAALFVSTILFACTQGHEKGTIIEPQGDVFRIDASGIMPGDVKFYRYTVGKRTVVFLVARTNDGQLKTAFDACITCYPHRKGYACESGRVVCVYCGTAFELEELGVGRGNCVPIQIKHTIDGNDVIIDRSTIEAGARWF